MKVHRWILVLVSALALAPPIVPQNQTEVRLLTLGQPIERELKGEEAHSFLIPAASGQYLEIVVDQRGIDVAVAIFDVNDKKIAEIDSPNGAQGPEPLSVIVETAGNYRLEVRSLEKSAPAGRYEAKIVQLRSATEKDKDRISAQRAYAEAEALGSQGEAEAFLLAIKKYDEALRLYRASGDKLGETSTLNQIGTVYYYLGEKQQALRTFNESLPLFRALGNKQGEAHALNNLGRVYDELGEKQRALTAYNESLLLSRAAADRKLEAITLNNIGAVYDTLGEKEQALKFYSESLPVSRAIGDKEGEADTVANIGVLYDELGEKQLALKYFNQALPLRRAIGDRLGEGGTLNSIGGVYKDLGQKQRALEYFGQSLAVYRAIGNKQGEAYALGNLGRIRDDLGEKQQALKYYNESLPLSRAVNDKYGEAVTLHNMGKIYDDLGERQQAVKYYIESVPLRRLVSDKRGEAETFYKLSSFFAASNPRLAVFYGKLSVNNYQVLRTQIRGIDRNVQKTFLRSIEMTYRKLADALIKQHRLPEAQQVLNSFKDQQFFDFRQNKQLAPLAATVRESELTAGLNQKLENVVGAIRELEALESARGDHEPTADEAEKIKSLQAKLTAAYEAYRLLLTSAEKALAAAPSEMDISPDVTDLLEMQTALRDLQSQTGQKAVAIYTLQGEEAYRGLLITPNKIVEVSRPIKATALGQKALAFIGQLGEVDKQAKGPKFSAGEVQKTGKELYDIVFAPVASKLRELGLRPDVLMWSLDGGLRYLPVGALYDSRQYLAQRYRNVVFTRANAERMLSRVSPVWTGSGFYNSKEYSLPVRTPDDGTLKLVGFDGLKNAKTEVETIFGFPPNAGIISGDLLSNEQFTKEGLFTALKRNRPLVHIASHFKFEPGDESSSFLLLGDGRKLTLEEIAGTPDELFKGVELLTLSACETGVQKERESDGREIDGFAELAQRKGARSVLASLWKVDDESTSRLMTQFYRIRQAKKLTKAEALQTAQLSLLRSRDHSHPYYWSPFILIGNWK